MDERLAEYKDALFFGGEEHHAASTLAAAVLRGLAGAAGAERGGAGGLAEAAQAEVTRERGRTASQAVLVVQHQKLLQVRQNESQPIVVQL